MDRSTPLFMVQLTASTPDLIRATASLWSRRNADDIGIAMHHALTAVFGQATVQPYRVREAGNRSLTILGYAFEDSAALAKRAALNAEPLLHQAFDWTAIATKPMPGSFPEGRSFGFEVRVVPVVRLASTRTTLGRAGEELVYREGCEVDAWFHECRMTNASESAAQSRAACYSDWLAKRLAPAATLESCRLLSHRRIRVLRQSHEKPRAARVLERPEAVLAGTLTVKDSDRFYLALTRGIGRHKAFGFGMLLLRAI